jgi:hypothetical protein
VYRWNDSRRAGEVAGEHRSSPLEDSPETGESPEGEVSEGEDNIGSDILDFLLEGLETLVDEGMGRAVSEDLILGGI